MELGLYTVAAGVITELLKRWKVSGKWCGLLSLALGFLASVAYSVYSGNPPQADWADGLLGGLAASGIFSGGKALLKKPAPVAQ